MYFALSAAKGKSEKARELRQGGHNYTLTLENLIRCIYREITEGRHSRMSEQN